MDSNGDGIGDFPGLIESSTTFKTSASPPCGCCRSTRRRCATTATTSPTTPPSTRSTATSTISNASSKRPTAAACASSPSWSSTTPPTSIRGSSAPAGRRPAAPNATSTSGATRRERFKDARIIFKDFESSNWTWDPVANAYYWHRFYSHQPDLNYDNPLVQEAVFRTLDFWMDMGVDGFRLDAIPYLYEREGTNCENLPETHAFLKKLRRHVDEKYPNRLLAGGGQPVAGGRRRLLRRRRRRRVPHVLPLPGHAAAVHVHPDGGPPSHRGHPPADAGHPRSSPVGAVPAQPRRADAGDGHGGRPRLHVPRLRPGPAGAHQPRHPPPPGAADAEQPPQDRADERPAAVAAGHAGALLRRRDRHGRQHLPRRPQRRPHADAVVRRTATPASRRPTRSGSICRPSSIRNITSRRSTSRRSRTTSIRCCGG